MTEQQPQPCTACNGAGSITTIDYQDDTMTSRSDTCPACAGTGRTHL